VLLDKLLSSLDVGVEPFSLCQVGPERDLRLPGTPRVTVHFVLEGCGFVRSALGKAQDLEPCSLAVVPRGVAHSLEPRADTRTECAVDPESERAPPVPVIAADPGESPELTVACGFVKVRYGAVLGLFDKLPEVLVEDLQDVPQVRAAFRDILDEQSRAGPGSEALKAALMSQCMVHLLRRLCTSGTCSLPWLAALEDERLARALDRMLRYPGDPHTVESLARTASMSRSAFADAFANAFGSPPLNLLRGIRLERAWTLLEHDGDLGIDAVATRVGFTSRSHFSRAFKKHFGISPAAHRAMP